MGGDSFLISLLRQTGIYTRSLAFYAVIGLVGLGGYWFFYRGTLLAQNIPTQTTSQTPSLYDMDLTLTDNGSLYLGNNRLNAETTINNSVYRLRSQIINHPEAFVDQLTIAVHLPKPGTEETVSHRFVNNGGALSVESQLVDSQTIVFTAHQISPAAQLAIELEVPKSFVRQSAIFMLREKVAQLPLAIWSIISVGLPALTGLILLLITLARNRRVPTTGLKPTDQPPSNLKPALLGILLRGRLTNRELAATLIDLARRGHLVIRQARFDDFRFTRADSHDRLEDFEQALVEQIFGPVSHQAGSEELNFNLAQETFSHQVSQAFVLAYKKMAGLGYFYTDPLSLHRRYQISGIFLFILGLTGFFTNLLLFGDVRYSLIFWLGMMIAALLITHFSKGLPTRTALGDRELARWLMFGQFIKQTEPVNYQAQNQDKYLAYLSYAIVLEMEVEWTKRFYDMPFAQPTWYIAPNITTVDEFANRVFPLFGYLSHLLAVSSQPGAR